MTRLATVRVFMVTTQRHRGKIRSCGMQVLKKACNLAEIEYFYAKTNPLPLQISLMIENHTSHTCQHFQFLDS